MADETGQARCKLCEVMKPAYLAFTPGRTSTVKLATVCEDCSKTIKAFVDEPQD